MSRLDELQAQLTQTETAISNLVSGGVSMYSTPAGGQVQRLSLGELEARAANLRRRISKLQGGSFVAVRRGGLR